MASPLSGAARSACFADQICPSTSRTIRLCRRSFYRTRTAPGSSTSSSSNSNIQPLERPARLRFAPSPTGYLHLGGLRTALFNHLYARSLGGKWILRIEDTDQNRFVPGTVAALQETLEWAKLEYDEGPSVGGSRGPYVQSERLDLYRHYAEKLVEAGKAYRDFRAEVVAQDPDAPRTKSVSLRENYIPPDEAEARHLISLGKPYVIRLRADPTSLRHHDLVYGDINFPADPNREGSEDPILLKSSGWPTYHLANVVDDHEMGITHALRGEEWLPSLPKHIWLYRALGLDPPKFAHLPLLVNADGTKLSKRSGDVRVESYREKGFEPEALNNFLGLMGYNNSAYHSSTEAAATSQNGSGSPPNQARQEQDSVAHDVLTMDEMIRGFDIQHVNRSRATADFSKLYYLNARHINLKLEDKEGGGRSEILNKVRPKLIETFPELEERLQRQEGQKDDLVEQIVLLARGTSPTVYDIPESAAPLFRRPAFEDPAIQSLYSSSSIIHTHFKAALEQAHHLFSHIKPAPDQQQQQHQQSWSKEAIHEIITQLPQTLSRLASQGPNQNSKIKKAAILAPLRFGITGKERGAPLADLFHFLGQQESLNRLQLALNAERDGLLTKEKS